MTNVFQKIMILLGALGVAVPQLIPQLMPALPESWKPALTVIGALFLSIGNLFHNVPGSPPSDTGKA